MTYRVRKSRVDKDTYLEFVVEIAHSAGTLSFCGLCGNTGQISTTMVRTPSGCTLPPVKGYCICPNGRACKYATTRPSAQTTRPP